MATTKTEWHTQHHYPIHPFGRYAGRRFIERLVTENARNYDPIPLTGCTLDDPLGEQDKAALIAQGVATIDTCNGQFTVDYVALRAHVRTVCGVMDEDLSGLTWKTTVEIIRHAATETERPLPLSKTAAMIYEKLLTLKPHEAMLTREIQDWYEEETGKNLDEGTWKNLRKEMEAHGLRNRPRVGYYIDQKMTS